MPVSASPSLTKSAKPDRSPGSRWLQGRRYSLAAALHRAITIRLAAPIHPRSSAPIVCASRIVTGGLLLVTMRTVPQASRSYTVLLQVTTLSDELSGASQRTTAQCGSSLWPVLNGRRLIRAQPAHPRARATAHLDGTASHRSTINANATCRAGKQHDDDTNREWCPESLVARVLLKQARRTVLPKEGEIRDVTECHSVT